LARIVEGICFLRSSVITLWEKRFIWRDKSKILYFRVKDIEIGQHHYDDIFIPRMLSDGVSGEI